MMHGVVIWVKYSKDRDCVLFNLGFKVSCFKIYDRGKQIIFNL